MAWHSEETLWTASSPAVCVPFKCWRSSELWRHITPAFTLRWRCLGGECDLKCKKDIAYAADKAVLCCGLNCICLLLFLFLSDMLPDRSQATRLATHSNIQALILLSERNSQQLASKKSQPSYSQIFFQLVLKFGLWRELTRNGAFRKDLAGPSGQPIKVHISRCVPKC